MMNNEKHNLNEFITADMFMSLTGCSLLVCGMVQLLKGYFDFCPMWLTLICSFFVTVFRIVLKEDFSFKGILLGLMQIVPILLSATGTYEVFKNILS